MKIRFLIPFFFIAFGLILVSCKSSSSRIPKNDKQAFDSYWRQDKSEVSVYAFDQLLDTSHYKGQITFIFELENFSKKRGFKLDEPKKHPGDAVEVMQCNQVRQWNTVTGQSNMMTSVFTALDYKEHPHSIKWESGYQDWSGQTFLQANYKGFRYETRYYSSFANEGDVETKLVNTFLEDEIWNKIRVSPDELPVGNFRMVPAAFYIHSSHTALKEYDASATITEVQDHYQYSVTYPDLNRKVIIHFEKEMPHKILGWTEMKDDKEIFSATLLL